MPAKRRALEELKKDELLAAVDRFELAVGDRRVRDNLIGALSAARKAPLGEILSDLSRDRLKEICRALGLDDSGREKALLINRLTGEPSAASASASKPVAEAAAKPAATRLNRAEGPPAGKLTREALERYLWSAADILRGSIDSSDYKNYILGLLFLKRLSDRFEEESAIVRAEGQDPEDSDEHQFFVPKRARWSELRKVTSGLGEELNRASHALEDKNPALEGVLAGIDFNDERKLGDTRQRDNILARLLQHFSQIDLRNDNLSEPDLLGRAYEYLIERFADDAGKKGGEFYTPHQVVKLMVEILEPQEGMRICDPTCGSGGMLIQCAEYVARHGGNLQNLSLFGQEKNLGTWALCKMNLLLHSLPDAKIYKGDTIREPKILEEDGSLMLFDRVIANPPFSLDEWGREVAEKDPYGRFRFGLPPKGTGDLAFVQHMVATLNSRGRLAVVMPHGILFRGGIEAEIRRGLLKEDLLEIVISLPANLFYGTGIPAVILVANRTKEKHRTKKLLFVAASGGFGPGANQHHLRPEDIERIASTAHKFAEIDGYSRVVGIDELLSNEYNLNVSRYIAETPSNKHEPDLNVALESLWHAEAERDESRKKLDIILQELGYAKP